VSAVFSGDRLVGGRFVGAGFVRAAAVRGGVVSRARLSTVLGTAVGARDLILGKLR
jgi:hypothetical protein